jgi:hypothetical protein
VSRLETIAKLEVLLARVRARGQRPLGSDARPPALAPLATSLADEPIAAFDARSETSSVMPTLPPSAGEEAESVTATLPDLAAEGGVAAEEATASESFESRERLVAAAPAFEAIELAPEATTLPAPNEGPPAAEVSASPDEPPPEIVAAEEDVEEAPASSRRPVALEAAPEQRLAEIAFGAEEPSPPRHTPPPESGRLPAASPVSEFDADITGVRDAPASHRFEHGEVAETATPVEATPPVAVAASAEPVAAMPARGAPAPAVEQASAMAVREIVPESIHPPIASSDAVADLLGEAQRFAPPSFVALLDASLAL